MKECFDPYTEPRTQTLQQIAQANEIIEEYLAQGYRLTLRQLYYRFVAAALVENTERSYKNIGRMLDLGRMTGMIDWDAIEDRTRNLVSSPHWRDPGEIIEACARQFAFDKWRAQVNKVEVWVEKEALAGVVGRAADQMDCPFFSCRGYPSQSAMYEAGKRMADYAAEYNRIIVLHLGDHDPSGMDMTRDIRDRLQTFAGSGADVVVDRIALNMDQIEHYRPPPNPAKITDSRADNYIAQHGTSSWELDALPPQDLHDLIVAQITNWCDMGVFRGWEREEQEARDAIQLVSDRWDEVNDFIAGRE